MEKLTRTELSWIAMSVKEVMLRAEIEMKKATDDCAKSALREYIDNMDGVYKKLSRAYENGHRRIEIS